MKIPYMLCPLFIVFVLLQFPVQVWAGEGTVKIPSLLQICQEYSDEPMISEDLYQGKMIETSVEVASKREIPSTCSDAEQGTFTGEFVADNYVVQCVCNAPPNKQVFDKISSGDILSITGTFRSMTSAFFEGGAKTCQITIYGCALELGTR
ncbi:MAG: hypothetical protein WBD99_04750 [Thermodesulfobacteriota bacterium]